jgi:hypothetical protein
MEKNDYSTKFATGVCGLCLPSTVPARASRHRFLENIDQTVAAIASSKNKVFKLMYEEPVCVVSPVLPHYGIDLTMTYDGAHRKPVDGVVKLWEAPEMEMASEVV